MLALPRDFPREMSSSEGPSPEMPSAEASLPPTEASSLEMPSLEMPSHEMPRFKTTCTETPPTEVSSGETHSTEKPSNEMPPTETPRLDISPLKIPPLTKLSTEIPSNEMTCTEMCPTETPSRAIPSIIPHTEVSSREMPSPESPPRKVLPRRVDKDALLSYHERFKMRKKQISSKLPILSPPLPGHKKHRTSCHRCGNIRKNKVFCGNCVMIFCAKCADKMVDEHGKEVFKAGCPVCQEKCCCGSKSGECSRKYHCYKKCPCSKRLLVTSNARVDLHANILKKRKQECLESKECSTSRKIAPKNLFDLPPRLTMPSSHILLEKHIEIMEERRKEYSDISNRSSSGGSATLPSTSSSISGDEIDIISYFEGMMHANGAHVAPVSSTISWLQMKNVTSECALFSKCDSSRLQDNNCSSQMSLSLSNTLEHPHDIHSFQHIFSLSADGSCYPELPFERDDHEADKNSDRIFSNSDINKSEYQLPSLALSGENSEQGISLPVLTAAALANMAKEKPCALAGESMSAVASFSAVQEDLCSDSSSTKTFALCQV